MALKTFFVKIVKAMMLSWAIALFAADEVAPFSASLVCRYIPGLNEAQYNVCMQYPGAIGLLNNVTPIFYNECNEQFQNDRWNCSSTRPPIYSKDQSLDLRRLTKETAFVHALTNAALVHIIARACSHGELPSLCGCDNRLQGQEISEGKQWGGCSDNVEFGKTFAKKFLDAIEIENLQNDTDHALVKLHNNKVGRLVVNDGMVTRCKCHGVSGSCSSQTCWRRLPDISTVSNSIKKKFEKAVKVSVQTSKEEVPATLREVSDNSVPPSSTLVFMKNSINYCISQKGYTRNRKCIPQDIKTQLDGSDQNVLNGTVYEAGLSACEGLCCNGEYEEETQVLVTSCNCKFFWCCNIVCQNCQKKSATFRCTS